MQAISTPELDAMIRSGAWVAFSLSGGKDGTAAAYAANLHLDALGHDRSRRIAYHADLGRAEWRSTDATVARQASFLGLPLQVVRHGAHDMISRWQRRGELGRIRYAEFDTIKLFGPWSAPGLMFCQSEMKRVPLNNAKKLLKAPVISVLGLRRAESRSRSKTAYGESDATLSKLTKHPAMIWNPIAHWEASDVFGYHAEHGIPLHEAYSVYNSSRLSCAFCILGNAGDRLAASSATQNHHLYRLMVEMEIESGFSHQAANWLGDVAPHLLSRGQAEGLSRAKAQFAQRRLIETDIPPSMLFRKDVVAVQPTLEIANRMAEVRRRVSDLHGIEAGFLTGPEIIDKIIQSRGIDIFA